ncbi:MAG: hypothetical protein ACI9WU_002151 [Myxococcota bacterium]|jgi:hypothetical protein
MAISPQRLDHLRRNSRLRLDKEGRWSLDGRPVEHPRVQRLFHQGVRAEGPDAPAPYSLHVGEQWAYIQFIEDTAYFVVKARIQEASRAGSVSEAGRVVVSLADGTEQDLDPASISMSGPEDLYCVLANGHRARFGRDALAALLPLLEEDPEGPPDQLGIRLGPVFHSIRVE